MRLAQGHIEQRLLDEAERILQEVITVTSRQPLAFTHQYAIATLAETLERQGRGETAIELLQGGVRGELTPP